MGRHVIPVSPNSLYAYLQVIVARPPRARAIETNAREIQARLDAGSGGDLDKLRDAVDVRRQPPGNARKQVRGRPSGRSVAWQDKLEGIEQRARPARLPGIGPEAPRRRRDSSIAVVD